MKSLWLWPKRWFTYKFMSQPIRISQLITMSLGQLSTDDFMPIVDSGSLLNTKRVTVDTLRKYFLSGSYTGSAQFGDSVSFYGTASYARGALSSSYAKTASFADYANNSDGMYQNLNPSLFMPGIKVGHVIRRTKEASSYTYVTASTSGDISGSEAIGIVVDSGSSIRVCYQGIADFSNDSLESKAPYLSVNLNTGSVYFLTSNGQLTATEPTDEYAISKPILVAITTASGLIVNYRGIRIAPNSTTSSLLSSLLSGGSGSFTSSLAKIPAYLRTTLLCVGVGGNVGYNQFDEVESHMFFTTGSFGGNIITSPFLTTRTNPQNFSFTASFKDTGSWIPLVSSGNTPTTFDFSKWKIKVYA